MTETKWPKGPWIAAEAWNNSDTFEITTAARENALLAEICTLKTGYDEPFKGEQQAALDLILAAPDLYEMGALLLKWAEKALAPGDAGCDFMNGDGDLNQDGMDGWDELGVVINAARAALAKARGEED